MTAWQATADGYGVESATALDVGAYTLTIGTVADLAGQPITSSANLPVEVKTTPTSVFAAPFEGEQITSTVGNTLGFQGLPIDEETGFYYVRHRYYDPSMGRFTQPDPLGYVDGPSMYAFAMYNPVSLSDPLGLCVGNWLQSTSFCQGVSNWIESSWLGVNERQSLDHGDAQFLIANFVRERGRLPDPTEEVYGDSENFRWLRGDGRWVGTIGETYSKGHEFILAGIASGAIKAASQTASRGTGSQAMAAAVSVGDDVAGEIVGVNPSLARGLAWKTTGSAKSVANGEILKRRLAVEEISQGHAFEKHVVAQGEFRGLGIRTRAQFEDHIRHVMENSTGNRYYRDGRMVYLHEPTGTVVIRNPNRGESTAFQPQNWKDYLSALPKRDTPYQ